MVWTAAARLPQALLQGCTAQWHSFVLGLLGLCAPYKGCNELKVLTTGLKMLQLVLSDAALLQQTQQCSSAGDGSSDSATTAASGITSSTTAAASPAVAVLAAAAIGPLTDIGPLCAKGEDDHPFSAQLFPPMPWPELMAAEELLATFEGGELLPLFGGLLRDAVLVMNPAGALVMRLLCACVLCEWESGHEIGIVLTRQQKRERECGGCVL